MKPMRNSALLWVRLVTATAFGATSFPDRLAELQRQLSADPANTNLLFKVGDLCYDAGAEGDAKAVELAEKYFKRLLELAPNQPMPMALLGSTTTMKARDAFWPNVRMRYAKEGIRIMDAAVKLGPESPEVRFVRAENNFHMPKFLDREGVVRSDFDWLWQQVQK